MDSIQKPLKEYLAEADEASGRASELSRNLGLGAIAVIWIFKNPESVHSVTLLPDKRLVWALLFAVSSLGVDLFQYIYRASSLYWFYGTNEKKFNKNLLTEQQISDMQAPSFIAIGSWIFWGIKIVSIVVAYILISVFLFDKL